MVQFSTMDKRVRGAESTMMEGGSDRGEVGATQGLAVHRLRTLLRELQREYGCVGSAKVSDT